jgi:hypothetical protein
MAKCSKCGKETGSTIAMCDSCIEQMPVEGDREAATGRPPSDAMATETPFGLRRAGGALSGLPLGRLQVNMRFPAESPHRLEDVVERFAVALTAEGIHLVDRGPGRLTLRGAPALADMLVSIREATLQVDTAGSEIRVGARVRIVSLLPFCVLLGVLAALLPIIILARYDIGVLAFIAALTVAAAAGPVVARADVSRLLRVVLAPEVDLLDYHARQIVSSGPT